MKSLQLFLRVSRRRNLLLRFAGSIRLVIVFTIAGEISFWKLARNVLNRTLAEEGVL